MKYLIGLIVLITVNVLAKPLYKIAIIDSGIDFSKTDIQTYVHTCKNGHYDFVKKEKSVGTDTIGHGTRVAELLVKVSKTENFCIMYYRIIENGRANVGLIAEAIKLATKKRAEVINISMTGPSYSFREYKAIKYALSKGIKIFVAAGNDKVDLDSLCMSYPACYKMKSDNFYVIGAFDRHLNVASYSNFGEKVTTYKYGNYKDSAGTSFATPRALGEYINSLGLDK